VGLSSPPPPGLGRLGAPRSTNNMVNDQSLQESNALLAVAADRTEVGQMISASPAELARDGGVESRLSVARAIRALLARGRIAQEDGGYRLLDSRPLTPGEPATVRRPTRRRRGPAPPASREEPPTYDGLGRALIERLIEVSAEASELRASLERSRGEADAARREAVEVNRQAAADRRRVEQLEDELATLRKQVDMTEVNLKKVLEAAKGREPARLEDTDTKAILDILSRKDASQ
jgi:hypothetical protein